MSSSPALSSKQPKSILKKTAHQSGFSQLPEEQQHANRDYIPPALLPVSIPDLSSLPREQQLAHEQALLLQRLSASELKPAIPLETIELLSSFPTLRSPPSLHPINNAPLSAANPSPSDTTQFLSLIKDFTPTEYLELIEERNCLGACGYVLCPRKKRNYEGEYKIIMRTGNIARTEDLNKWCSDECAVRALYVKVQLDNPSYVTDLETGRRVVKVELREEKKPAAAKAENAGKTGEDGKDKNKAASLNEAEEKLASDLARLDLNRKTEIADKAAQMQRDADALAVERGQGGGKLDRLLAGQGVEVTIREKPTTGPAKAPDHTKPSSTSPKLRSEDAHHMVEGHKPTFGTGAKKQQAVKKDGSESESEGSDDDDINDYMSGRIQISL
ncbi:Rtr1/RPAP2 family-domain-containing protein [Pseudoneurospora amorphoporcata]|uniref:RNA polymerase II subunit B1 CTD phosphatase RPAP2 homolog n=1 Tax=Pseudoneurospora amorphoporcata TaxID=241081 RepID=A0AAN6SGH2_9PEZI|nr:Rtr1/RPAP2 family-domain-containing protein [Pseudoneurospora amorphoporcata]